MLYESAELVALLDHDDIGYDDKKLEDADAILCAFAEVTKLDVTSLRDEDICQRTIHGSARRWGCFIEMVL